MAIAIIGDVHGCLYELKALIKQIYKTHNIEEIIFVGDLVDKGPNSPGVLKYVRKLGTGKLLFFRGLYPRWPKHRVTIVRGNHEDKNIRFWSKDNLEEAMKMKNAEEMLWIQSNTSEELRAWLQETVVTYAAREDYGFLVVHGGLDATMDTVDPELVIRDGGYPPRELNGAKDHIGKKWSRSMFIRYLDKDGNFVRPSERKDNPTYFWAEKYDGRYGFVYFGHHPWEGGPKNFEWATGLDTGCVHGGRLCAVIVQKSPAIDLYWKRLYQKKPVIRPTPLYTRLYGRSHRCFHMISAKRVYISRSECYDDFS